jgi:hypothetical protein
MGVCVLTSEGVREIRGAVVGNVLTRPLACKLEPSTAHQQIFVAQSWSGRVFLARASGLCKLCGSHDVEGDVIDLGLTDGDYIVQAGFCGENAFAVTASRELHLLWLPDNKHTVVSLAALRSDNGDGLVVPIGTECMTFLYGGSTYRVKSTDALPVCIGFRQYAGRVVAYHPEGRRGVFFSTVSVDGSGAQTVFVYHASVCSESILCVHFSYSFDVPRSFRSVAVSHQGEVAYTDCTGRNVTVYKAGECPKTTTTNTCPASIKDAFSDVGEITTVLFSSSDLFIVDRTGDMMRLKGGKHEKINCRGKVFSASSL